LPDDISGPFTRDNVLAAIAALRLCVERGERTRAACTQISIDCAPAGGAPRFVFQQ